MKLTIAKLAMAVVLLAFLFPDTTHATAADLFVREINITGNEFLVLQSNAHIAHLSDYWVGYTNNDSAAAAPSQQLADVVLDSGQSIILNSTAASVCDASYEDALGFSSFNNSAGTVALWKLSGGSFTPIGSNVTWKKGAGDVLNISSQASGWSNPTWYNDPTYGWVTGDLQGCSLSNVISGGASAPATISWSAGIQPAVTIISTGNSWGAVPAGDVGLAAVQITELLPNPAGAGNDNTDEYVELYNPNNVSFDLSGFTIESGLTTKYDYTFPLGTTLPANAFAVFYSADTNLTLSNSGGQVWLLDPGGNIVSQSDAYNTAKDGIAWALAGNKWSWTAKPTPGAANIIELASSTSKSKIKTTPQAAGASIGTGGSTAGQSPSNIGSSAVATPVHPLILVGVGAAALLYGGYEYRADLANNVYKLRRYYEARRANRPKLKGRRSHRATFRSWRRQNHLRPRLGQGRKKQ